MSASATELVIFDCDGVLINTEHITIDIEVEMLAAWVAETLARYKVPTVWDLRSEPLPRNAAGKVLKQDL